MRILALDDYDLPGSHTRSLIFSDRQKVIEPASYGQPENLVGKVWFFYRCLNGRIRYLCGRHREQARSHRDWMFGRKRLVGCQAAIAGKPAPTGGSAFAFRPSPLNRYIRKNQTDFPR
jgi:hypothetical protein